MAKPILERDVRLRFVIDDTKMTAGGRKIQQNLDGIQNQFAGISGSLKAMPALVVAAFAVDKLKDFARWLKKIGEESVMIAGQYEATTKTFETMLGSAAKATAMLRDLNKFSLRTPFAPGTVNEAAKVLLNFGIQANKILPTLQRLGDVSGGNQQRFQQLSLVFGQIASTGRLMGQDLLQLINAGFNPLQVISEKTGKSVAKLKDEMSKGLISFEMVEQAFIDATSEGGKFFGLMEKQADTLPGKLSTLEGAVTDLKREFGEALLPAVKPLVDLLIEMTQNSEGLKEVFVELGRPLAELVESVVELIRAGQEVADAIRQVGIELGIMEEDTNLVVLALKPFLNAITGLAVIISNWSDMIADATENIRGLTNSVTEFIGVGTVWTKTGKAAGAATGGLNSKLIAGVKAGKQMGLSIDDARKALDKFNATTDDTNDKAEKSREKLDELTLRFKRFRKGAFGDLEDRIDTRAVRKFVEPIQTALESLPGEAVPVFQRIALEFGESVQEQLTNALGAFERFYGAITTLQDVQTDRRLQAINAEQEAALRLAGVLQEEEAAKLAAMDETEQKRFEIEQEFAAKRQALEQEAFDRQKRFAKLQAVINGALAVTKILAEVPKGDFGVATAVLIGAAIAQTAAQVATIEAQQFAEGGLVKGGIKGKDSVAAWLMPDEFVMPVKTVNKYGIDTMEAMRQGRLDEHVLNRLFSGKGFSDKGIIGSIDAQTRALIGSMLPSVTTRETVVQNRRIRRF